MCAFGKDGGRAATHTTVKPMLRRVLTEIEAGFQFPPHLAAEMAAWVDRCQSERLMGEATAARNTNDDSGSIEEIGLA